MIHKNDIIFNRFLLNDEILKKYYWNKKLFNINQKGGGFTIEHKENIIKFDKVIDDDRYNIFLSTLDKQNNCIMLIKPLNEKVIYINSLSNDAQNKCFDEPLLNNGKEIMDITSTN